MTYSSPSLATSIVESARKTNTETFILQEPSNAYSNSIVNALGTVGSIVNGGFMLYLGISLLLFFLVEIVVI